MNPHPPQKKTAHYGLHDSWTLALLDFMEWAEEDREQAEADAVEHIQHGETLTVEEE